MQTIQLSKSGARLATLEELRSNLLPHHLIPMPCNATLRAWFDQAKVQRFKANPTAKRGGGNVFYSVSDVEKFLRSRTIPGRH